MNGEIRKEVVTMMIGEGCKQKNGKERNEKWKDGRKVMKEKGD